MRRLLANVRPARAGFSIVEFITVTAIIALLLALLLPAVQQIRATARQTQCRSNLHQIGLAANVYEETFGQLPDFQAGGLLYGVMPYVEQRPAYEQASSFLRNRQFTDAEQAIGRIPVYLCPEDPLATKPGDSSYLVNMGLLDALGLERAFIRTPSRLVDVTDGLSQTALVSENVVVPQQSPKSRGGWMVIFPQYGMPMTETELDSACDWCLAEAESRPADYPGSGSGRVLSQNGGYNHVLPPNSPRCVSGRPPFGIRPAWSNHPHSVNTLFADGAVKSMSNSVDRHVWWALGSINGGDNANE